MSDSYTFEKKKKLIDRIKKITLKSDLIKIKKIVTENNPDLDCMKNGNGYFMEFDNLSSKTYLEITKFLDKTEKKKLKELETEIMETSVITSDEKSEGRSEKKTVSKKLRLTNTETHILNRIKYENELKKNEEEASEEQVQKNNKKAKTNDIFVKTSVKKTPVKTKK